MPWWITFSLFYISPTSRPPTRGSPLTQLVPLSLMIPRRSISQRTCLHLSWAPLRIKTWEKPSAMFAFWCQYCTAGRAFPAQHGALKDFKAVGNEFVENLPLEVPELTSWVKFDCIGSVELNWSRMGLFVQCRHIALSLCELQLLDKK